MRSTRSAPQHAHLARVRRSKSCGNYPIVDGTLRQIMVEPVSSSHSPTLTSTSLILRIQAGEAFAWERFTRLYGPLIYSWCSRAGLQPSDAEDVSQNVVRAVLKSVGRYERTGSFRSWLGQITRSKIIDHFRQHKRQFFTESAAATLPARSVNFPIIFRRICQDLDWGRTRFCLVHRND